MECMNVRVGWLAGEIRDVPLLLYVSLLSPCLDSEKLCIAVDLMKGTFLVSLAQKGQIILVSRLYCVEADIKHSSIS